MIETAEQVNGASELLAEHEVAIVGTGFAGLGMAIRCRQEGIDDFVVLERAESLGGTWRDNHYPGCACDVPSPLYSFSFAPNPGWSHMYAHADEIRAYLEQCADRFDVRRRVRFGANVTGAHWDAERQRWTVMIDHRPALIARFVVGGFGALNRPTFPSIDGLEEFEGALFHSAHWNDDVPLAGRRVGVIGTGASAIQIVPQIAPGASHVTVFQRTAPWVLPKADRPITRMEKRLYPRVPAIQRAIRAAIFAITEGLATGLTRRHRILAGLEQVSRAFLRVTVNDPEKRRQLTPDYRLGCKRILFSNDYFQGVARSNVAIETSGIQRVTPSAVVTSDGVEHPVDALVAATGFDIEAVFTGLDVRGVDGITLDQAWAGGMEAHRGTTVAGFPNMALLSGPNTGTGSTSQVFMIESQIDYVLAMISAARQGAISVR
ncbi:MAG TPA: NAD(P)/FAD-dependent oxidoreductase, partial [Solirubrobacteraceae bacterium]|nr:NAD(P)/FAD-dependent oxidoreductase [Solirubrobacteraceae bacterium]